MAFHPSIIRALSQHAGPINSPTTDPASEEKRLADKFAARSSVAHTSVLFLNAATTTTTTIAFTRDATEALGTFIHCVRFRPGDNVVVVVDAEHLNQTLC
ncbi:hypothetical protein F4811DRAFT_548648 [Daldinia bambusicola]|nr:hypothetical protein F4811DRAFT_548648 [Daldinia bambusicola]